MNNAYTHIAPRFPFHARGLLELNGERIPGTLLDLSIIGAVFETDRPRPLAAEKICKLDILYAGSIPFLHIDMGLTHHCGSRIGIEFLGLDANVMLGMQRITEMNLAPPKLLKRDVLAPCHLKTQPWRGKPSISAA